MGDTSASTGIINLLLGGNIYMDTHFMSVGVGVSAASAAVAQWPHHRRARDRAVKVLALSPNSQQQTQQQQEHVIESSSEVGTGTGTKHKESEKENGHGHGNREQEKEKEKEKATSFAALKDLAAGTISGIACKSVEYPFDTVKVRMQMAGESRGPVQILMEGVQKNGLGSLYRGIPGPMVGAMGENAILFVVYGRLINGLKYINSSSSEEASARMPTMTEYVLAGGGAGAAVATLLTPVELIKCRMQMEGSGDLYKNDLDCFIKSTRNEGLGVMFKVRAVTLCGGVWSGACFFLFK